MNEKTLRALIAAGAIKKVFVIANGSTIHVEVTTATQTIVVQTLKGKLKTWASIDSAAKWIYVLGLGLVQLDISKWKPKQRGLRL